MKNLCKVIGKRIVLAPLRERQISKEYIRWMQDADILRYLTGRSGGYSQQQLKKYVVQTNNSLHDCLFGIFLKESDIHIGNIKIGNINSLHKFADLGLIIGNKDQWGRGYATEAISLATQYAFKKLNLNKLTAGMVVENIGSYKAFLKAGYKKVGKLSRHVLLSGKYADTILLEKCR